MEKIKEIKNVVRAKSKVYPNGHRISCIETLAPSKKINGIKLKPNKQDFPPSN